uniref:Recombination signal binding protein for immunoglobulin kappa J region n=1 Tax=Takifugu rubripes TaxID=31033 RepID=A0A674MWT4_TAKRU
MDGCTEVSLTVAHVVRRLRGSHLHSQLERQAKDCLHQPEIKLESLKEDVRNFLKTSGWERKLQNAVYRELHIQLPLSHPAAPPEHLKEPLAYMRKAQAGWEKRVLKSLNSMSTELEVPLARMRPAAEQKELENKWNEMGTDEPDLSRFRPVYAPKDFLEVLISLRNPNYNSSEDVSVRSHWGLIQVPISVRDVPQLRQAYPELNLSAGQLGIDDHAHIHPGIHKLAVTLCSVSAVLSEQDSAAAQQYSRRGCPTGLRADVWALILNATNQPQDVMYYEQLKAGVIQHDLLVDKLIYKDVKLTASNDDDYFVFEDFLYQVLLCFSRDTTVLEHFAYNSATPPRSYVQGEPPPPLVLCVIPFHGFSMYVAPLCFLYNEPSKLYSVFKEMYIRYFFRLHSITSSPSGIVSLCLQFECLLQTYLPQLFYHLRQVGAQPSCFKTVVYIHNVVIVWVLGIFSLIVNSRFTGAMVPPFLAAAVFAFRAENLMEVTSSSSAEAVLADLSTLKVMPLIQIFLFATSV